jgi:pyruvate dehydrogenase E2 component (dihydrolipoamide acetyltransferase)
MPQQFLLPDLGEGLTEAEITAWLVQPGDMVEVDQPVVEVESAKSIVELPSPFAGVVGELCAQVGQTVHAGEPLLSVIGESEAEPEPVPAAVGAVAEAGTGAVLVGYGAAPSAPRRSHADEGRFGRGRRTTPAAGAAPAGTADTALIDPARRSRVVSPIVRRIAHEAGFEASSLRGSGPDGLVVKADVEAAIARLGERQAAAPAPEPPAAASVAPARGDQDVRIPITGIREIIGTRLSRSRQTIPEATIWLDVDATPLIAAKERLQAATGEHYGLTALLARFVVAGLKRYPALNSSVDEGAHVIVQHAAVNLGIAAQTPRGLLVPVIHGAHELPTDELRARVAELTERARTGDYPPAQLAGSTFTLDNYGGFGIDGGAPIINPPEAAILGVGRLAERPWVVGGELAVRKVLTLTLVFDHRVCDGDVASAFLTWVARCIEEPLLAL